MGENEEFEKLRARIWDGDTLYEDRHFPATGDSVTPDNPKSKDWLWKRPREIVAKPVFIQNGADRRDLEQGETGDCWFISAANFLTEQPDAFAKVVPNNQNFDIDSYAGIFHFYFWKHGRWEEVIIDDRLPVDEENKLRFCHNKETPNEFWPLLLEKAYAKLFGSYKALSEGNVRDAMVDFTGGLSESYNLRKEEEIPVELFDIMVTSSKRNSSILTYIWGDYGSTREEKQWNGLYKGHVYSISCFLKTRVRGWQVRLLRLRNPWGQADWTGPWSTKSEEWNSLKDAERRTLGIVLDNEDEFWMSYDDWLSHFHVLDIIHRGPEALGRFNKNGKVNFTWKEKAYHGKWIKGINAGGSGLLSGNKDMYFTNPQYHFTMKVQDDDDVGGDCTCIISLMQKEYKSRKLNPSLQKLIIGFDVHHLKSTAPFILNGETPHEEAVLKKQYRVRTSQREITCRLALSPGEYVIIPCTSRPNQSGEYLLRIYTYIKIRTGTLTEEKTEKSTERKDPDRPTGTIPAEVFQVYAEQDEAVDARDLRDMLNALCRKELKEATTFGMEACRSLVSLYDKERSGLLDHQEVNKMWEDILFWRKLFHRVDKDKSGYIDTMELRKIFPLLGFTLSLDALTMIVARYGGKERALSYEDFILCISKTLTMHDLFRKLKNKEEEINMTMEEWMTTTLYY